MNENEARNNAGRLGFDIKGFYDNTVTYDFLDVVYYNNSSYVAKKLTVGNEPNENNEYWQILARGLADAVTGVKGEKETEYRSGKVNITAEDVGALPIDGGEMQGNLDIGKNIIKAGEGFNVGAFTSGHDFNIYNDDGTGISFTGTSLIPRHQGDNVEKLGSQSYPWGEVWAKNAMHASDFVAGEGGTSGRSLANLSISDLSTNNHIDVLTSFNQITSIGFWKINSIDGDYAQSIGIRAVDNTGDFYAIVSNYNGDGVNHFVYGNLQLYSPRLGVNHFEIQVWSGTAAARYAITYDTMLNTTEQISANTESFYAAGALALKKAMADYNAKINQINSNMAMVSVSNTINGSADIVSDAYHTLCSFTPPLGVHLITINVAFPSNDMGFRRIGLSLDGHNFNMNRLAVEWRQAVSGNITTVSLCYIHVETVEHPLYLMAQQNSGSTLLNCAYGVHIVSLENAKRYTIPYEFLNI